MARPRDNLTKVIHLRVTPDTKAWYEKYAKCLGISEADTERLALAMFIRCGGIDYKEKD